MLDTLLYNHIVGMSEEGDGMTPVTAAQCNNDKQEQDNGQKNAEHEIRPTINRPVTAMTMIIYISIKYTDST